ncbi:hypothetical protein CK203_007703 [Vitis vinifera]|uniref:Uncharacterized protein n=1 Tax=Vitis vinifera TaxID=29760 RepID=A0A438K1V4_VITVI|nr:hypothetical protein CK203_007703 [Vitis vinifera]
MKWRLRRENLHKRRNEEVITLRSGKEVDLPTCKLEHKVESETEKEKREEIKGKKKGKSIEKDGYDVNVQRTTEDSHQGRIDEETHASTFSPSFVWKIIQKVQVRMQTSYGIRAS